MTLTKDTDKLFCLIYEEFLNRRKLGFSKEKSKLFEHPAALQEQFLQGIHEDDIHAAVIELNRKSLIKKYNNNSFVLTDDGIIYMENRFKNGLKEVLAYISLIK